MKKTVYTPFHYEGRFQFRTSNLIAVGIQFNLSSRYLRQGITLHLPFLTIDYYIHSRKKAWEIFDKQQTT